MKRKNSKCHKSPLIRLVGLEAAAAVASMSGAPALAAPGDLDPSFGDVGRQSDFHSSFAYTRWSVEVQDDDSVLLGGGGEYCPFGCYEDYFVGRLLSNGTPDASFSAAMLQETTVFDTALQADGKLLGVGFANNKLQVFRLRPDGALDPDFGLGGLALIGNVGDQGHSVVVDPDGRIVVAGSRHNELLVVRLQPHGTLDVTFGNGGIYVASEPGGYGGYPARIARAPGGGYRVTAHGPQAPANDATTFSCRVFALTDAGTLDAGYGTAGIVAAPASAAASINCSSLALQSDGRLLLGGQDSSSGAGYLTRLLVNGAIDPGFHAEQALAQMTGATAIGVGSTGSIFVAGEGRTGLSGALVVRLLADGTLDALFGRAGVARVDVSTRRARTQIISDMEVTTNDAVVIAGSATAEGNLFVARLLGNAGGGSPGVLSMTQERFIATEQGGQAVLSVRRTGGSEGAVAVTYASREFPAPGESGAGYAPGARANSGADFTATTGRLTWGNGDVGDREIVVPVAADTNDELPEFFEVVLESPEGGAGIGARGADVEVAGAGYPAGALAFLAGTTSAYESGQASIGVTRNLYGGGAISVTVRLLSGGSATPGQDFHGVGGAEWQDVVLTWSDGELGAKYLSLPIASDILVEQPETFTVELVSPTGGAVLGDRTQTTVTVFDPPPLYSDVDRGSSSGGGTFGWLGALLLGLGGALRRRRIRNR